MRFVLAILAMAFLPISWAEDASRIRELENEVSVLRRVVVEQGRRLEELERQSGARNDAPHRAGTPHSYTDSRSSSNRWHIPSNWDRIKSGMSESQVGAILGSPTSAESVGPYRTIFYRGEVGNSGSVSGNVKLQDDRVWQVNKPVF